MAANAMNSWTADWDRDCRNTTSAAPFGTHAPTFLCRDLRIVAPTPGRREIGVFPSPRRAPSALMFPVVLQDSIEPPSRISLDDVELSVQEAAGRLHIASGIAARFQRHIDI